MPIDNTVLNNSMLINNSMYMPDTETIISNFFSLFNVVETVSHAFGYSSATSEVMDIISELYHNTVITLGYVLYIVLAIICLTIYYFNSRVSHYASAFNRRVEYLMDSLFVIAPIIIIYCLSVPAVGYIVSNDATLITLDSPFYVEIVGHQWYWTYYLNTDVNHDMYNSITHFVGLGLGPLISSFTIELDQILSITNNITKRYFEVSKHVILPAGENIRCELTSVDVVHSWAIPQLGVKVDAIPGRVQTFYIRSYLTGLVYGQCSEFCGENHAFMPVIIEFVEVETFLDWVIKSINYNPYNNYLFTVHGCVDISSYRITFK